MPLGFVLEHLFCCFCAAQAFFFCLFIASPSRSRPAPTTDSHITALCQQPAASRPASQSRHASRPALPEDPSILTSPWAVDKQPQAHRYRNDHISTLPNMAQAGGQSSITVAGMLAPFAFADGTKARPGHGGSKSEGPKLTRVQCEYGRLPSVKLHNCKTFPPSLPPKTSPGEFECLVTNAKLTLNSIFTVRETTMAQFSSETVRSLAPQHPNCTSAACAMSSRSSTTGACKLTAPW